jgi:anti-sigma factor RsiW
MNCETARPFLDSYADGELDLVNHVKIEEHLEDCFDCDVYYKDLKSLKTALTEDQSLYFRSPDDLRRKIRSSLREIDDGPPRRTWVWRWAPAFAALGIAFLTLLTIMFAVRPSNGDEDLLANEIVSAHIRSLMVTHMTDVPSTDQHTVKPWFEGKLDFSPPVIDLGQQGFTLIGGRLDYAGGRPIAAIIYQRRQHVINLFIYPSEPATGMSGTQVKQGFSIVHWNKSGMAFWAVSDLNPAELQQFCGLLLNS